MCGIAAIFNYSNAPLKVDGEELLRVRDRMITRGPDGAGIWLSDDGKVYIWGRYIDEKTGGYKQIREVVNLPDDIQANSVTDIFLKKNLSIEVHYIVKSTSTIKISD